MTHIPHLVISTSIREQEKLDVSNGNNEDSDTAVSNGYKATKPRKQARKHRLRVTIKRENIFKRFFG